MDKDKSGVLDVADLQGVYDGSKHPDVIAGKRTEADVLRSVGIRATTTCMHSSSR
jgi:hypothetical protein